MTEHSPETQQIEYRFPDTLRDLGRSVAVLDMFVGSKRFNQGDAFRLLVGEVDNIFPSGTWTAEIMNRRSKFDKDFPLHSEKNEKTLKFGRTTIYLASPPLIEVTVPSKHFYDKLAVQSMQPNDILETFGDDLQSIGAEELIVIPPRQYTLDELVPAVEEQTGHTPHIGYYVTYGDGYEGGFSWKIDQYVPGMENRMEKHVH